jgi:hypothetical protein
MSATAIVQALNTNTVLRDSIGIYGWAAEQKARADRVLKYRRYYDGDHDVKLTAKMKEMLREQDTDSPFSDNYCELVVNKVTDRLKLEGVFADNDATTTWAGDTLRKNRIDALALSVHDAVVKDGDTYLLEEWDADNGYVRFTHEPAWDGTTGMLVLYDRANAPAPVAALKIWYVTSFETVTAADGKPQTQTRDDVRVNVYYADRIERYVTTGGSLQPVTSTGDYEPGKQKNLLGRVPVVHFRYRSTQTDNYGRSKLRNIIPLQNVLNRTLVSMVMTSENTSFQRLVAKNVGTVPATVSPGGIMQIFDPEGSDAKASLDVLEAGEILPFTDQANWTINQIATIGNTPLPGWEMSGESGEAKKQREEGLIGEVGRATVNIGNSWEDALKLAHAIQATYSSTPPAYEEMTARWGSPQVRNDTEVIDNALKVKDTIPYEEYLRIIAPVYKWDEAKITQILAAKEKEDDARMARLQIPTVPPFNSRQPGNMTQNVQPGQQQALPVPVGQGVAAR